MITRQNIEETLTDIYSDLFESLKYQIISSKYIDIFKESIFKNLQEYFDKKSIGLKSEFEDLRLITSFYSRYRSKYLSYEVNYKKYSEIISKIYIENTNSIDLLYNNYIKDIQDEDPFRIEIVSDSSDIIDLPNCLFYNKSNGYLYDKTGEHFLNTEDNSKIIEFQTLKEKHENLRNIQSYSNSTTINSINNFTEISTIDNLQLLEQENISIPKSILNNINGDNLKVYSYNNSRYLYSFAMNNNMLILDSQKVLYDYEIDLTKSKLKILYNSKTIHDYDLEDIYYFDIKSSVTKRLQNLSCTYSSFNKKSAEILETQDDESTKNILQLRNVSVDEEEILTIGVSLISELSDVIHFNTFGILSNTSEIKQSYDIIDVASQEISESYPLLDDNDSIIKFIEKQNNHFIKITTGNDLVYTYKIPNPNYIELKSLEIIGSKYSDNLMLRVNYTDESDDTEHNLLDLHYDTIKLKNPKIIYPESYDIYKNTFYVTYVNGLVIPYIMDKTSFPNVDYNFDIRLNESKVYFDYGFGSNLSSKEFNIKQSKFLKTVSFSNKQLLFGFTNDASFSKTILSNENTIVDIPYTDCIEKLSDTYEYSLEKTANNLLRLKENDSIQSINLQLPSSYSFDDIYITNFYRDFNNGKICIEYSNGDTNEYIDVINSDLFNSIYEFSTYSYNNGVLSKTIDNKDKRYSFEYPFNYAEKLLNNPKIKYVKNDIFELYVKSKLVDQIVLSPKHFEYNYEIYSNRLLYDFYGDLSVFTYKNKLLRCDSLNLDVLYQRINIGELKTSYIVNNGHGFLISYDQYTHDDSNVISDNSLVNVTNRSLYLFNTTKVLKIYGTSIDIPIYTFSDENLLQLTNYTSEDPLTIGQNNNQQSISLPIKQPLDINKEYRLSFMSNMSHVNTLSDTGFYVTINGTKYYNDDITNDSLLTFDINFVPETSNTTISIGLNFNGKQIYFEFWNITLKETKRAFLDKGVYITM